MFEFLSSVLHLGEDIGSLRRRSLRLGEGMYVYENPMMDFMDFLVRLGKAFVRLGEPLLLGKHVTMWGLCSRPIWG